MKKLFTLFLAMMATLSLSANEENWSPVAVPDPEEPVDMISTIWLYFDETTVLDIYQPEEQKGIRYPVVNEKGDSVACAYVINYQSPIAILKVMPNIYDAGTYTIKMGEGYLWLYDNTTGSNKHIAEAADFTFTVTGNTPAPVFEPVFSPAAGSEVGYLQTIDFTVPDIVAYGVNINPNDMITVYDENDKVVCNGKANYSYGMTETDSVPRGIIELYSVVSTPGKYRLHIPASTFKLGKDWENYYNGDFETLPETDIYYNVTGKSDLTPYRLIFDSSQSAAPYVKVEFPTHTSARLTKTSASYDVHNIQGYWENFVAVWDNGFIFDGNVLKLKFFSPIRYANTYILNIPAGDITFEDGTTNTAITLTFSVSEPKPVNFTSVPAEGETVPELMSFDLTFTDADAVAEYEDGAAYIYVYDSEDNKVLDSGGSPIEFCIEKFEGNTVKMRLISDGDYGFLATPGKYRIEVKKGSFFVNSDSTAINPVINVNVELTGNVDHDYTAWGYYQGSDILNLSLLSTGLPTNSVAMFVPSNEILAGGKIGGMKVPINTAYNVTSLTTWVAKTLPTKEEDYIARYEASVNHTGFNTVYFPTPIALPEEGCYIGYDITIEDVYYDSPIVVDDTRYVDNSLYVKPGNYDWQDIASEFGCSAMQVLFTGIELPDVYALFGPIDGTVTVKDSETVLEFPILVNSANNVKSVQYATVINGVEQIGETDADIEAGVNNVGYVKIPIKTPSEIGYYDVKISVKGINGTPYPGSEVCTSTLQNVSRYVDRKSIVEEFTGTGCGFCPRGLVGMENMRREFGEKFIGLAIHKYNSEDPMFPTYYTSAGLMSAPDCIIDRKRVTDPYCGDNDDFVYEAGMVFEPYSKMPASADLQLKASWAYSDKSAVKFDVDIESLCNDSYEIVYVVVADSLTGDTYEWKQSNFYYQAAQADMPDDLKQFCRGGANSSTAFFTYYNDVIVGSSYNVYEENLGQSTGMTKPGDVNSFSYTIALPMEGSIADAVSKQLHNVYAVAFALDSEGNVAQAAKVNVDACTLGIENIATKAQNGTATYYNIAGQRMNGTQKGVNIINGRKFVVK